MMTRVLGGALVVSLVLLGLQSWRLRTEQLEHQRAVTSHAQQVALMETMARQAEVDARAEEQRRVAAAQEVIREALEREARARADAAAAAGAHDRLRRQVADTAARGRCTAGNPATAGTGPSTDDPIGVLADVLERADRRAGILAEAADAARTAGLACERAYDSLTR